MIVNEALPWRREHRRELLESIQAGKHKPQPVRRKEIPKPDGGARALEIPTVIDRVIQQAIGKVKEYAEQGHRKGNTRKGYWAVAGSGILTHTITNKRLAQAGYYSILQLLKQSKC